jgi:nucleotide-binding universal stress UspA family protein
MRTILVAVDGSIQGSPLLRYAFETYSDAEFIALSVIDPTTRPEEYLIKSKAVQWLQRKRAATDERQQTITELASEYDVSVSTAIAYGRTAGAVVDRSEQTAVDQILVGRRPHSNAVSDRLGDVVPRIIRRASVPVTVVRTSDEHRNATPPESVLVPVDGSDRALGALDHACETFPTANMTALTVRDTVSEFFEETDTTVWDEDTEPAQELSPWQQTRNERSETILQAARDRAEQRAVALDTVAVDGSPVAEISTYVEANGIDHLYMGRTGRTSYQRLLLGSTTMDVLRRCAVPVTVVPQPSRSP